MIFSFFIQVPFPAFTYEDHFTQEVDFMEYELMQNRITGFEWAQHLKKLNELRKKSWLRHCKKRFYIPYY